MITRHVRIRDLFYILKQEYKFISQSKTAHAAEVMQFLPNLLEKKKLALELWPNDVSKPIPYFNNF